ERLIGPDVGLGLTDADDAPDCPAAPVSRPGDLWQCGVHRVLCGDALQAADMQRLMVDPAADLIVTDPPYNVAYVGKAKRRLSIANDALSSTAFYQFLLTAFTTMLAVGHPGMPAYVFHADLEGANFRRAFSDSGFYLAQCGIWAKPSFVIGRQDYHWQHEPVLYGWKPGAAHRWYGDRKQSTLWPFERPARSDVHPTMKPVALVEYLIMNGSRAGDVVLDPFGGSGTTLMACERTRRLARLMEIDPRYCDVIVQRWQAFSGQHALRESDGVSFEDAAALSQSPATHALEIASARA
ncbi:DNA-methyltransferase, partial [Burkholderia territorii]